MPFTLAHPAAVLLLRRAPLPVAAMVAGAMAPDLPVYFDGYGAPYDLSHSALGIVTVDLGVGLLALALWFAFVRDALVDVMPAAVRERLDPHVRYGRRDWLLAAPAVALGATTHVGWDLFTHRDRWGVQHLSWLQREHGQLEGFAWAQYVSSVVGLALCAGWAYLALRARPRTSRPVLVPALGVRALVAAGAITVASGIAAALNAPEPGWRMLLSQTAVVGAIIGAIAVVALAGAWNVLRARGRRAEG